MMGPVRGVWLAVALLASACGSATSPERGVGSDAGGAGEGCECEGTGESDAGVAIGEEAVDAGDGADAGVGQEECETGDSFCEGQVLHACVDGRWVTEDCRDNGDWGQTCYDPGSGATCSGQCAEGRARCSGDDREVCDESGNFDFVETCTVCIDDGECVDCVNDATKCDGLTAQFTCSGDRWGSSVLCVDSTCFGGVNGVGGYCQGDCVAGEYRCAGTAQSQRCDSEGAWYNYEICSVSPPEICDEEEISPTYGQCIDNSPAEIGESGTSPYELELYDDDIVAQPIEITEDVVLVTFGMRTTPNSVFGNAYLSLHEDSDGQPSAIINRTTEFPIGTDSFNIEPRMYGDPANVNLVAGTRYWIVAKISAGPSADVRIYVDEASPAGDFRIGIQPYGVPADLSPGATGPSTGEVTLFIKVQK